MNKNLVIALLASTAITACGGGGGGGGSTGTTPTTQTVNYTPVAFTDKDSVELGTTVRFSGDSVQTDLTVNPGVAVTSLSNTGDTGTATVDVTYDFDGQIIKLVLDHSNGSALEFEEAEGDNIADASTIYGPDFSGILFATGDDGAKFGMAADAVNDDIDFSYQTFGVWERGRGATSAEVVAATIGVASQGSNIPTSGTATYDGWTGGAFLDELGQYDYLTVSELTAVADFGARSVSVTSDDTILYNMVTESFVTTAGAGDDFDFSGTLTYSAGSNDLSGSMTMVGGQVGTMRARFYGPNAEEIGGTFHGTGDGFELYTGSFGAKR